MAPEPVAPFNILQNADSAARLLLGWKLVSRTPDGLTAGYIVEAEAYSSDDPASHTFRGQTPRNASMFQGAGTIYIYFTYGMHYCCNIVTGPKGSGQGVLLRAIESCLGIEVMRSRRLPAKTLYGLTNGPAKLVQAMGIDPSLDGSQLGSASGLWLEPGYVPDRIVTTTRVGVVRGAQALRRFYVADNPYVSVP